MQYRIILGYDNYHGLSSVIKNQLSFNKILKTQLAHLAVIVPYFGITEAIPREHQYDDHKRRQIHS